MTLLRVLLVLVLAAPFLAGQTPTTETGNRILEHVKFLASEECSGRAPATDGIERAARYIVTNFNQFNLEPVGDHGTYRNMFTMTTAVKLVDPNSVWFETRRPSPGMPIEKVKPTKMAWKLGQDYQPFGFTDTGKVSGRIVFAGYGLSPHGANYDDYKDVDVKGAIVVVLAGLPKWAEKDNDLKLLASVRSKATTARDKGAVAIVVVNEKGDSSDVLARFGLDRMGKNAGIMALQVRRTPCAKIFPPEGKSLFVAEKEIESTKKPSSFELLNTTAKFEAHVAYEEGSTYNIVGMVRGTDPTLAGEYVIVGAHYDHLGMGDENSRHATREAIIHPGADDNGSGTSGVIELAQRLSKAPAKRSVVFMAFSGEEKGLMGSKHWVSTPSLPLNNVVAMINMDMIGRLKDNKLNVHGVGTSAKWQSILDSAVSGSGLKISTSADGFGPSDHASFVPKKIPVLFYFTGLHTDYHRPSDTWDKINYDGEAQILDVVERSVRIVADGSERLTFADGAEKPSAKVSSGGFKVSLGVIPDYSDDPQGLRIDGVRAGTPAEKAGMQAGDILTQIGSTKVKNIYDLTAALSSLEPGNVVDVVVLRDGKEVRMKALLTGR